MDPDALFSKKIFINPGRCRTRRAETEDQFFGNDLEVERFPGIDSRWVDRKNCRTFSSGDYAEGLSLRMALRRAIHDGEESLLVFSDEVILRDGFRERIRDIEIPDDWGLFFFGCEHRERPEVVSKNLVRVRRGGSRCAFAVRRPFFRDLFRLLKKVGYENGESAWTVDQVLWELSGRTPAYAAFPNVAWSNPGRTGQFDHAGNQKGVPEIVDGIGFEAEGFSRWIETPVPVSADVPRIAFLFLTVGDVNHPRIWEEYFRGHREHYEIFHHCKEPDEVGSDWLRGRSIGERLHTTWGDISLVRATNALIRAALNNSDCDFFILVSESCIPIKPLPVLRWALRKEPRSWINLRRIGPVKPGDHHKTRRVESATLDLRPYWQFHSQWVGLNREAALAATGSDCTEIFESVFAADESYYGTVLDFIGYPQDRIASRAITRVEWPQGWSRHPKSFVEVDRGQAMNLAFCPHFFARKFPPESNIGDFKLHLGYPENETG